MSHYVPFILYENMQDLQVLMSREGGNYWTWLFPKSSCPILSHVAMQKNWQQLVTTCYGFSYRGGYSTTYVIDNIECSWNLHLTWNGPYCCHGKNRERIG